MENKKKKAWIYTHIDAPEDSHGALKTVSYTHLRAHETF